MRKLLLFLLLILLINECYSQNGWVRQLAETTSLRDAIFVNENTGWVFGNVILKTTNGGNNWFNQSSPLTGYYNSSASFLNENTGWIYSFPNNGTYFLMDLKILKTTDGGNNWSVIPTLQQTHYVTSIYAVSENVFFLTTSFYSVNPIIGGGIYYGNILKTTNGGSTYSEFRFNNTQNCSYSKAVFLNNNTGFVSVIYDSTQINDVLKTTDAGTSWLKLNVNNNFKTVHQFQFLNSDIGFIYGFDDIGGKVMKTTNGGSNWLTMQMHDSINDGPRAIFFLNNNTGWVCGRNLSIAKTTNSGNTWVYNRIMPPLIGYLNKVYFVDNLTGWVFGGNGSESVIYKTTNGGVTFVNNTSTEIPYDFSLSQNYPNPFNPATRINYELPITNYVSVKVYDALGNEIETLVNEKQNPGSYSVDFNAASLPSGIYFYKLVTEKFSETKKMVLVK